MKVDWSKTVADVPMRIVRDILRDLRRGHSTRKEIAGLTRYNIVQSGRRWSSEWKRDAWRVNSIADANYVLTLVPKGCLQIVIGGDVWSPAKIKRAAEAMADALLAEGLLQPYRPRDGKDVEPCYEVSKIGLSLTAAKVVKRFDRAQAERCVTDLLTRADALNADADAFYSVRAIWVYGSYAKGAADLGDIDLFIHLTHPGGAVFDALSDDQHERLEIIDRLHRRAQQRLRACNRHLHILWYRPDDLDEKITGPVEQIYPRQN